MTAKMAIEKGIRVLNAFFTENFGKEMTLGGKADLMICNNVLAHVPDINDFVRGFTALLKDDGVATFEFPHLLSLVKNNQFDTIYHERLQLPFAHRSQADIQCQWAFTYSTLSAYRCMAAACAYIRRKKWVVSVALPIWCA